MSNRLLIQWCFESCAKSRVCKSPTNLWLSSQMWLILPNLNYGPTKDLQAEVVHEPVQSQSNNKCCSSIVGSAEGILRPGRSLTTPTPKVGSKSWHCDALVIETWDMVLEGSDSTKKSGTPCLQEPYWDILTLYRLLSEPRDFFLGQVPESQWLRHCLHDRMPSVILFPLYLCEQHLPLLSCFLCGSGRGGSLGLWPSCASPADNF